MTKRLQKSTIVILLTVLLCLVSVVMIGSSYGGMYGGANTAQAASVDSAPPTLGTPIATYYIGNTTPEVEVDGETVFYTATHADGWNDAVAKSRQSNGVVRVVLTSRWSAATPAVGFATEGIGFNNGSLYVPYGANIWLDLNSYMISRGFTQTTATRSTGDANSRVISVSGGTLNITDTSDSASGIISGGYVRNTAKVAAFGGGVYLEQNATLNLIAGNIQDNFMYTADGYGIGVAVTGRSTFNMYGGSVRNNVRVVGGAAVGGGVAVFGDATFNMYAGKINGNRPSSGGGVATASNTVGSLTFANIYGSEEVVDGTTVYSTEIYNNTAGYGGGVAVVNHGMMLIDGAMIRNNNVSMSHGGGAFVRGDGGAGSVARLTMRSGHIENNNVAYDTNTARDVYGGGVAVFRSASSSPDSELVFEMSGGNITGNKVKSQGRGGDGYGVGYGGGVSVDAGTFIMSGNAVIADNDTNSDVGGYGGGVAVFGNGSKEGVFDMRGGTVENNTCRISGGGVYLAGSKNVGNKGILNISGGKITANTVVVQSQNRYSGCGVYVTGDGEVRASGDAYIYNNFEPESEQQNNIYMGGRTIIVDDGVNTPTRVDAYAPIIVNGKFNNNAKVGISMVSTYFNQGYPVTSGYGDYNYELNGGIKNYIDPLKYFACDIAGQSLVIAADPTVAASDKFEAIASEDISFEIGYYNHGETTLTTELIQIGGGSEGSNYGLTTTYGDRAIAHIKKANADGTIPQDAPNLLDSILADITTLQDETKVLRDAGTYMVDYEVKYNRQVYTFTERDESGAPQFTSEVKEVSVYIHFMLVINPKDLSEEDVTLELNQTEYVYEKNTARQPLFTTATYTETLFNVGSVNLIANAEDYSVEYFDNVNVGTATARIKFTGGNYSGHKDMSFAIRPAAGASYTVKWQVNGANGWEEITAATKFVYNPEAENQNNSVRAELTIVGDSTVYVYADESAALKLVYSPADGGAAVDFKDAGNYTVAIVGDGNYNIANTDRSKNLTIDRRQINIKHDDFTGDNLWRVEFTVDGEFAYSELLSNPTYANGNSVETGAAGAAYARYRAVPLTLALNPEFSVGGVQLSTYLNDNNNVSFAYTGNVGTGESGTVTTLQSQVVITFDDNYSSAEGEPTFTLNKTWYIVTINNRLRNSSDGSEITASSATWSYGHGAEIEPFRPEHGNTVFYSYLNGNGDIIRRFAAVYADDSIYTSKTYYEVKLNGQELAVDTDKPVEGEYSDYFVSFNKTLDAGSYTLNVVVPRFDPQISLSHRHWWENTGAAYADLGVVYYTISRNFAITVNTYSIASTTGNALNADISYEFVEDTIGYNGKKDNVPEIVITVAGIRLEQGKDYTVTSEQVSVGKADLIITGLGNLNGSVTIEDAFEIVAATNRWVRVPNIIRWSYNGFSEEVNIIDAQPLYLENPTALWFKITTDRDGNNVYGGLDKFNLDADGTVPANVASVLNSMSADGTYYLFATVDASSDGNYGALAPEGIAFNVFAAVNYWEPTPTIKSWITGRYNATDNAPMADAHFGAGTAVVRITDIDGKNVYYDTSKSIDKLASLKPGQYKLTAKVAGTADYSELAEYTFMFRVFEKPGLPWWATLCITLGALLIAALIIFILWKKGVFQILTEKIVVSIRTKASVDATIASVRAAKKMEEGKQSVADAKRRERIEQMRKKAAEQRALPPEERAAQLEERAKADEAKAEKLRARSEAKRQQAAKMRGEKPDAEQPVTEEPTAEAAATETQTEE